MSDDTPLGWSLVCPSACLTRAAHALVVCQTLLLHLFTEGFELLRIVVQTPLATSTPVAVRFRGFLTRDWKTDFSKALIPLAEIRSGGSPRHGIPPIDQPKFVSPVEAGAWLKDQEPVFT